LIDSSPDSTVTGASALATRLARPYGMRVWIGRMFDPIRRFVADHIGVFSGLTIVTLLLFAALLVFGLSRKGPLTTSQTLELPSRRFRQPP
jgi:hypothetical protein